MIFFCIWIAAGLSGLMVSSVIHGMKSQEWLFNMLISFNPVMLAFSVFFGPVVWIQAVDEIVSLRRGDVYCIKCYKFINGNSCYLHSVRNLR